MGARKFPRGFSIEQRRNRVENIQTFRQRSCFVEHTRSHPNSEFKRRKARSVLGWGTAREALRVLLAFCFRLCCVLLSVHGSFHAVSPSNNGETARKVFKPFANGHTLPNIPDPIRIRKSSGERPGQYWSGGPPGKPLGCCWLFVFDCAVLWVRGRVAKCDSANGHTSSNIPDPIRTRKSSGERPGQYWGGGPPGKPLGCCWLFVFGCAVFCYGCTEVSTRFLHRTTEKPRGKYSNLSPTAILRRTYPIPSELGSQAAKGPVSTGMGDRSGSP